MEENFSWDDNLTTVYLCGYYDAKDAVRRLAAVVVELGAECPIEHFKEKYRNIRPKWCKPDYVPCRGGVMRCSVDKRTCWTQEALSGEDQ